MKLIIFNCMEIDLKNYMVIKNKIKIYKTQFTYLMYERSTEVNVYKQVKEETIFYYDSVFIKTNQLQNQ